MSGRRETPDGAGIGRSYGELYVEYAPAARGLALSMVPPDVADDIVAEAFARVLAAIRAGGGPDHAFRPYLLAAVRNLANDWIAARRRVTVIGGLDEEAGDRSAPLISGFSGDAATEAEARAEARLIVRAFSRLPKRWRAVLWQLEVEGKAPAEVAPVFGLSGNGVSALAMRAREGLRQAYLQEHIGTNIPASCQAYAENLGAGARGRLSPRRQAAMQDHLGHCPACQDLFTELSELNRKLGTILAPIALAGTSAALHGGRHVLRAGLAAHWRAMRWHPVTAATGAAASVAVAGGMLFAVNVTPLPAAPSHVTVRAADPATNSGSPAGHHAGDRRGGGGGGSGAGGGGAGGTLTGFGTPVGGASVAATGPLPGPASLTGPASMIGTTPLTGAGPLADTVGDAVSGLTGTAGSAVTGLAGTAGATVTGLTGTVDSTVTGLTGTVNGTVGSLAGTAAAAVTGATSSALAAVSGVTGTVAGVTGTTTATISGVTGTVGGTVAGTASTATATVAGVASTASSTVSSVTSAASTVAGTANTAAAATTSTVGSVAGAAADAVTSVASTAAAAAPSASTASGTASPVSSPAAASPVASASSTAGTAAAGAASTVASTATSAGSTVSGAVSGATTTVDSTVSAGGSTTASTGGAVTAAVTGVVGTALG
jgi:RNA polymerase sigma factor (sigma-70 family)